ncbi:MAG: UvrD-helicase domain-containing protein [Acidobacteria bacterium]|nr:UvrD-helicase domain-containing protein [Acidobacteriota bacterium]
MQTSLFDLPDDDKPAPAVLPDQAARDFASDPAQHVVLEASAGTGKTRVLVDRYVRLIRLGVSPRHILAITFTRKAAAEMRERILEQLRAEASHALLAEIQVATIDAFCFGLLREFPLEAGVDPGFEIADETEMARFTTEALDVTMRIVRGVVVRDENVRLLFTRIKATVLQGVLATLLDRRQVALPAVATFVRQKVRVQGPDEVSRAFVARVRAVFNGHEAFVADGPPSLAEFQWVAAEAARLATGEDIPVSDVPQLRRRLERYFLTKKLEARKKLPGNARDHSNAAARKRHEAAFLAMAPGIEASIDALERDVDGLLARGLLTVLTIAVHQYQRLLDEHAVLDFSGMLDRAVALLERQEEFARSRLKLQARYHHLLVDEFQDTSRQQWRLVDLLIAAWGEGEGVADGQNSIFIVGDRKQSIYRFRHAEVALLDEAARRISALRPGRQVKQAITKNFRAVAELLAFVNVLASGLEGDPDLEERFAYEERDHFPVDAIAQGARRDGRPVLGVVAGASLQASADAVAAEIARFLAEATVRDRQGPPRAARPDDVAILFRARAGHQVYEEALEQLGIRTYVYKGLGFFDAPEVQDLQALLRFLAQPESNLRAAELLRSRFVRLSDAALAALAPGLSAAIIGDAEPAAALADVDRQLLDCVRAGARRWLALTDRVPAGELVDRVMRESMYAVEMTGLRSNQARENVKKVRALVRRIENRGYTTIGRLAEYFETLRAGDESNAVIEARGCVSLMTIHAAKGLEFPAVFVVNLHAPGRGGSAGVTVIDRSVDGEPEVAFRSTDGTRLEDRREVEELRRLLYVAVTRARDVLYLAGEVDKDTVLKAPKRSLASLLPVTLRTVFTRAALADDDEVMWDAAGHQFAVRVCKPPAPSGGRPVTPPAPVAPADVDREPLTSEAPVILSATTISDAPAMVVPAGDRGQDRALDRLAGTLVHRLFQHGLAGPSTAEAVALHAGRLARPEELVDVADRNGFFGTVAEAYLRVADRSDVRAWLAGGRAHYEVPFSFVSPERPAAIIRGSIDCLVARPDGSLLVLEFKTGAPRPEHRAQLGTYLAAVRHAFKEAAVSGELVYPGPGE